MHIGIIGPVGHQAAFLDELPVRVDTRQAVLSRKLHDLHAMVEEQPIGEHEQGLGPGFPHQIEGLVDFNIGHSIVARSVFVGIRNATVEMIQLIDKFSWSIANE